MRLVKVATVGALALAASAGLARMHPFGDAGLYAKDRSQMEHIAIPPPVRDLLAAKCANCHSEWTETPIYGRFAPVSWVLERHVIEGREAMNLSLWDRYPADKQQALAAKVVQETKAGKMPLPGYRLIHRGAGLSAEQQAMLAAWARSLQGGGGVAATAGDAASGKAVFEKRCTGCHALATDREGPRLAGVFGRASGSVHGFTYSPALQQANIVWDAATLDRWLSDPDAMLAGNNMDFRVAKPQERADLIAFLKLQSR